MAVKPQECRLLAVFAANVRRHRERLGLSQEELAERAGVHRTYIGMIERREKNVTIYNIERVADALGIKPAILLTKLGR
jgi:transcriptional regulator with XRE-family HTH domain